MTRIIAYTYEADVHCVACTQKRFAPSEVGHGPGLLTQWHEDQHGVPIESTDREGNSTHPVFTTDEHDFTHCGTCRDEL